MDSDGMIFWEEDGNSIPSIPDFHFVLSSSVGPGFDW